MFRLTTKLIMYRELGEDSILFRLSEIIRDFEKENTEKEDLIKRIFAQIHQLLELSTTFGFADNLWQNYLAFLLATNENPFSLTAEKLGAHEGSVNSFAKSDFQIFKDLFDYNFSTIEQSLGINCFSTISEYQSLVKPERMYNRNVSEKIQALSHAIAAAKDGNAVFNIVTEFYRAFGVGMFGLNKAFRLQKQGGLLEFVPINNTDAVLLTDLIGYELQKARLIANTQAFVEGKSANNVLLFGDAGTGKSSSIKAVLNEFYDQGLRMIEIYKHQFEDLSAVIAEIKNRNYRFIIYMDDLSFEEFEIEYKYLKAIIEGGLETKPDNVLIYATSNRRHLIRETWQDRADMVVAEDLHQSDTMAEKLSLVARFGISIYYGKPAREEYFTIVESLATRQGLSLSVADLRAEANKWELSHGGISGRAAQQLINYLSSKK
ncbi:MAG: ATP-binding protein [Clostridia bacterium]